jgi:CHAD domain-containing protein
MSRRNPPSDVLAQPAPAAAAGIVLARLAETDRRLADLVDDDHDDADALHDFRVALRRSRSALRAYRSILGPCARKKDHRRLRDISRATNAGRDAEVQIEWLVAHRREVPRGERASLNALLRELRRARRAGYAEGRGTLRASFRRASDKLRRHLNGAAATGDPLQPAFGTLLGEHARALAELLGGIHAVTDRDQLHQTRIAAKRLRYLLEPMVGALPVMRAAVRTLKGLQDILGGQRDVDLVLATLAVRQAAVADAGLARLTRAAELERDACWTKLEETWLTPASGGPAFLATLDDLGRGLAAPVPVPVPDPRRRGPLAMTPPRRGPARRARA